MIQIIPSLIGTKMLMNTRLCILTNIQTIRRTGLMEKFN